MKYFSKKSLRFLFLISALLIMIGHDSAAGTKKSFSTASSFKTAISTALPGDTLELTDGAYDLSAISITKSGTSNERIILRAQHIGQAELKGKSSFACKGISYLTIEGFVFTSDVSTVIKTESCNNIRITRNIFRLSETTSSKWILIGGTYNIAAANSHHNRIDHNLFENKKQLGNYVTIDGSPASLGTPEASQYDVIDHNHFRTIGPRAVNEMETIRIGQSEICRSNSFTLVEYNLFEECDGDPEIISVKTKQSTIRYNTFKRSQGTVCLRSSDSSVVEGNYFFGEGKTGTGGIRVYGSGHRIMNNYFSDLTGDTWDAALTITNGDAELSGSTTAHWRPQNILVLFNTYVNNANNLQLGFTNNGSYSKPPQNITIANNLIVGSQNLLVKHITQPTNITYVRNLAFAQGSATLGIVVNDDQIKSIDPKLAFVDSVWRLSAESPAINTASNGFDFVLNDIEGQIRDGQKDIGADEYSSSTRINRPLTAADVGPNAPDSIVIVTAVAKNENTISIPTGYVLEQNYPNPFNPITMINYQLPMNSSVSLKVFTILGKEAAVLIDEPQSAGRYSVRFDATGFASGIYFYTLRTGSVVETRKMMLLK